MSAVLQSFTDLQEQYIKNSTVIIDRNHLQAWQPRRSIWTIVQALTPLLPSAKIRKSWVDGHWVYYLEAGSEQKETLVLLHGFGSNKENWLFLLPLLVRRYRLLIPDIPGFGQSCFVADKSYNLADQSRRLVHWLSGIGVSNVHLVGNSMGGAIAAKMSADFYAQEIGLIKSLTLMNAAGGVAASKSEFELGLLQGRNFLIPKIPEDVDVLFRKTTHRLPALVQWFLTRSLATDMCHRYSINHHIFRQLIASTHDAYLDFEKVEVPTLILWGDQDKVLDASSIDMINAAIPHAKVKILKEVGHLPMLETPRKCAAALDRFCHGVLS